MAPRPGLALAPGGAGFRLHAEHQSGRALDPRARPHALGRPDGAQGRCPRQPRPQRDAYSGNHALPPPEAALIRPGRLMPKPPPLSLEGTVVAVAADRGHHFSKPPQEGIAPGTPTWGVDVRDAATGRVRDAIEIPADAHHALVGDAPFELENRSIGRQWQRLQRRHL